LSSGAVVFDNFEVMLSCRVIRICEVRITGGYQEGKAVETKAL
jgi:hypothetical protein